MSEMGTLLLLDRVAQPVGDEEAAHPHKTRAAVASSAASPPAEFPKDGPCKTGDPAIDNNSFATRYTPVAPAPSDGERPALELELEFDETGAEEMHRDGTQSSCGRCCPKDQFLHRFDI